METTKYREIVHLSVLVLFSPHLLGGPDVVLEVEVLEPLTMDRLTSDPGPNRGKRWVRTEPVVLSPRMLLVVESTQLDRDILQNLPGMYALPFATPTARTFIISINSSMVFWEHLLAPNQ